MCIVSRIAEALIANEEANLVSNASVNPTNRYTPRELPVQKLVNRPISMPTGEAAHNHNRDRSNSVDGPILRSLVTHESDGNPSPIHSERPPHSLPISPDESSPNASTSSSSPGGLLYNLLVSDDSRWSNFKQISPRRVREDTCVQIPEASTDLVVPLPKKSKVSNEDSDKDGSDRCSIFPRISSNGPRRFSFGGYSAPRGERIAAILRGPSTAPTTFKSNSRSPLNQTVSSTSSTEAPCFNSTPSILSALISSPCSDWSPGLSSASTDSGLDEPLDLTGGLPPTAEHLKRSNTSNPAVQLAKKTARPVQARISEWLRQAAEFVLSSSQVVTPGQDMWLAMFRTTWHRLLAISMAEHSLDVVVVENTHSEEHQVAEQILPWLMPPSILDASQRLPDHQFAGQLLHCLTELRAQQLSKEEFSMLRHVILLTGTCRCVI